MLEKLKNFKWGYVLLGVLLIALGVCLIALRETLTYLAIAIGVVLILFAIIYGTVVLASRDRGVTFAFKVIFSVIALVAGVVVLILRSATIGVMVSVFSLLLIIDASFKVHTSAMSKRYSVPLWWIILGFAVAVIVGGYFLIISSPDTDSISVFSIWLGIVIAVDGIANILCAFYETIYEKKQYKEIYADAYKKLTDTSEAKADEAQAEEKADPEEEKAKEEPEASEEEAKEEGEATSETE